jgi:adenine-specific DNA-methyltransferase
MYYAIKDPDGNDVFPIGPGGYESCWRFEKATYQKLQKDNYILWKKTKKAGKEVWWPYVKYYLEGRTKRPSPLWNDLDGNKKAARDLRELFDGEKLFDFPKPIPMLKRLMEIVPNASNDDIILDFFAGSASTAHAVLDSNKEDNGNRTFICVQIPQLISNDQRAFKLGYKTIAELSKERIRKAISKFSYNEGFRVLKLKESNFKTWMNISSNEIAIIEKELDLFNHDPLKDSWTSKGLLIEIILNEGFVLSSLFINQSNYKSNSILKIQDEFCEHSLIVCLDKEIKKETIQSLELSGNDIFICLDSAISNVDKLRLSDKGLIKTI